MALYQLFLLLMLEVNKNPLMPRFHIKLDSLQIAKVFVSNMIKSGVPGNFAEENSVKNLNKS